MPDSSVDSIADGVWEDAVRQADMDDADMDDDDSVDEWSSSNDSSDEWYIDVQPSGTWFVRARTTTTTATPTTTTATTTAQQPQRQHDDSRQPFTIIGGAGYFEPALGSFADPDEATEPEFPHGRYWHRLQDPNPAWLREFWRSM